jgi:hypothetical protein
LEPYLFSFLTFVLGLVLGNRLAIGRDRRKELNDATQPIRRWLINEALEPSTNRKRPSIEEIDTFTNCLPFWKRRGFRKAYEHQERERTKVQAQDSFGALFYENTQSIIEAVNACLPYTKRR